MNRPPARKPLWSRWSLWSNIIQWSHELLRSMIPIRWTINLGTRREAGVGRVRRFVMRRYNYRGVNHVHINVTDLERAIDFYTGILGFTVAGRRDPDKAWLNFGQHPDGEALWYPRSRLEPGTRSQRPLLDAERTEPCGIRAGIARRCHANRRRSKAARRQNHPRTRSPRRRHEPITCYRGPGRQCHRTHG